MANYRHIFLKVLELMERGYFSAEKLVTKKIKLENIVPDGFIELLDKSQIKDFGWAVSGIFTWIKPVHLGGFMLIRM